MKRTAVAVALVVLAAWPAAADERGDPWENAIRPRCYMCHGPDVDAELLGMALDKASRDETAVGVPLAEQVTRWHRDRPGFNLSADEVARILREFGAPPE